LGWKKNVTVGHPDKYIICLAPHTSNWDFVIGQLYMRAEGMKINFLMKKEWFSGHWGNCSNAGAVYLFTGHSTAA
jgi:1-acyl-sn-glycerol-3-phosphate acyltransferase